MVGSLKVPRRKIIHAPCRQRRQSVPSPSLVLFASHPRLKPHKACIAFTPLLTSHLSKRPTSQRVYAPRSHSPVPNTTHVCEAPYNSAYPSWPTSQGFHGPDQRIPEHQAHNSPSTFREDTAFAPPLSRIRAIPFRQHVSRSHR